MNRRFFLSVLLSAAALAAPGQSVWKIAGPPPESEQRDRVLDLARHRDAVMDRLGKKAILILYAAEPRNYAGDIDWPYRQENDFFYLTGITQAGSTLVLIPGAEKMREILFIPPSNPAQENWTGHILTPDEARQISGIAEIWDVRAFDSFLATLVPQAKQALGGAKSGPAPPVDVKREFAGTIAAVADKSAELYMLGGESPEYRRETEFTRKLAAAYPGLTVKDPATIFDYLRAVKSPREIDLLKHAVDITAEAFQRAFAVAVPGTPEYAIQAQFEFTFLRRNAHWGYPCIVASGVNATTLHYESNRDTMKAGDLLLMDDAAEYAGYSADVTRTIPVSGKYTKEQAEIYQLVSEEPAGGNSIRAAGQKQRRYHRSGEQGDG